MNRGMILLLCFFFFSVVVGKEQDHLSIPIIDISSLLAYTVAERNGAVQIDLQENRKRTIDHMHQALERWGLFHISNHSLHDSSTALMEQMEIFFDHPKDVKYSVKRNATNSRGYADDELTQQKRDMKEVFDVGQLELYTNLSTRATENQALDGVNLWPAIAGERGSGKSEFKSVVEAHYNACLEVARVLVRAITEYTAEDDPHKVAYLDEACDLHSSFLRLNHYSAALRDAYSDGNKEDKTTASNDTDTVPFLGVSPHTDAGILTILLQDYVYPEHALELYTGSKESYGDGFWVRESPINKEP
jgi:isopenicillin N synthase-like dioxygenase